MRYGSQPVEIMFRHQAADLLEVLSMGLRLGASSLMIPDAHRLQNSGMRSKARETSLNQEWSPLRAQTCSNLRLNVRKQI